MSPSRTSLRRLLSRFRNGARHFATANSGMAAAEFALVAPIFIIMFFGLVEWTLAQDARTKATAVASTAADIIAQEKEVCDAEVTDTFTAVNAIMFPFPPDSMKVRISSVIEDGKGGYKVAWSEAQNMSAMTVDQAVTLPAGLVSKNGSVIMAEINYTYDSPYNYFFESLELPDTFYFHPRKATRIQRQASCS